MCLPLLLRAVSRALSGESHSSRTASRRLSPLMRVGGETLSWPFEVSSRAVFLAFLFGSFLRAAPAPGQRDATVRKDSKGLFVETTLDLSDPLQEALNQLVLLGARLSG